MPPDQIVAFFIFALVAAITPGPSNVLILAAGSRAGFVGGLRCLAGVVTGMALLMGLGSLGLAGFADTYPQSLITLKWLGSAFLLWLAWQIGTAPAMSDQPQAATVGFWQALVFQWINPKSWVVTLSAVGVYGAEVSDAGGVMSRAFQMAGVFAVAATISSTVWLAFGASMKQWLSHQRRARRFNQAMGVLLALSVALVIR